MPGCRLDRDERARIEAEIEAGKTDDEIAAVLNRHRTTVSREIDRGGGRAWYRAADAHRGAVARGRRPRPGALATDPVLAAAVTAGLNKGWSPHAVAASLGSAGGPRCCAETIYRACYANNDAFGLPAGSWTKLPKARRHRRPRGRAEACQRKVLGAITSISERTPKATDEAPRVRWRLDPLRRMEHAKPWEVS